MEYNTFMSDKYVSMYVCMYVCIYACIHLKEEDIVSKTEIKEIRFTHLVVNKTEKRKRKNFSASLDNMLICKNYKTTLINIHMHTHTCIYIHIYKFVGFLAETHLKFLRFTVKVFNILKECLKVFRCCCCCCCRCYC